LFVGSRDGLAEIIRLSPAVENGPGLDLRLRLVSGNEIDASGGVRPVSGLDLLRDLRELARVSGRLDGGLAPNQRWEGARALELAAESGSFEHESLCRRAAIWHAERWMEAEPGSSEARTQYALTLIEERRPD